MLESVSTSTKLNVFCVLSLSFESLHIQRAILEILKSLTALNNPCNSTKLSLSALVGLCIWFHIALNHTFILYTAL